ncbi:MAG: OsmC family protein [Chitinophagales bacterium]|nr:OsmC family protein [Chitinophagales bacterium]
MPTQLKLKNLPVGFQTVISNGRHSILGDEPEKSKGTDLGFSPTEFFLAGIAMCKVATVRYIARRNGWEIGNVDGSFTQKVKRLKNGELSTHINVQIDIEGELTDEQRETLLYEADHCYVHRMAEGEINIESAIREGIDVA